MVVARRAAGNYNETSTMIELTPIGTIHSPFTDLKGMPVQPTAAEGVRGTVEVFEEYLDGLADLDGFSHIMLLYHFHQSRGFELRVVPFLDTTPRGLFATRAPRRPNPVGVSIVQLDKIEETTLFIQNIDVLDGTPLIDIKPYVPEFDKPENTRTGWLEQAGKSVRDKKSDERFKT